MTKIPEQPQRIIGFCWFHRETYDEARSMMADPEALFDTFDEWLKAARKIEAEVTAKGGKVVRVRFDLPAFMLYCASHNVAPYEQSRANWAAQEVKKKYAQRLMR
jgi:hypothetical protein